AVDKLYQYWATMLSIARDILMEAQEKQKIYADKKRHFCKLKEGEMELLKNLGNCKWLVDNFERKSKLSLSSEE
ncbi:36759_t:CDS:2, partial [Racocetra persica]